MVNPAERLAELDGVLMQYLLEADLLRELPPPTAWSSFPWTSPRWRPKPWPGPWRLPTPKAGPPSTPSSSRAGPSAYSCWGRRLR